MVVRVTKKDAKAETDKAKCRDARATEMAKARDAIKNNNNIFKETGYKHKNVYIRLFFH